MISPDVATPGNSSGIACRHYPSTIARADGKTVAMDWREAGIIGIEHGAHAHKGFGQMARWLQW